MKTNTKPFILYMKTSNWIVLLVSAVSLSSCLNEDIQTQNTADTEISKDFMFTTTQKVDLKVAVNDSYSGQYYYKVEVFDNNPFSTDTTSHLISAGVANANQSYSTKIAVPTHVSTLYIRQTDPLQRQTVKIVTLSSTDTNISCNFNQTTASAVSAKVSAASKVVAATPKASDYALPSSYTTLGSSGVTLSGLNYYLPTGVTNSAVSFGWLTNSALYVAGDVTFNSNFYMPGDCKLIILPGGKATFNTTAAFEQAGIVVAVQTGGTLILNNGGGVGYNSKIISDGALQLNTAYEIRSNGTMVNNGSIQGTQLTMTNNTTFENNGSVVLSSGFLMNSNTSFTNNGPFTATGVIQTNNTTSVITNNAHITTNYLNMSQGGGQIINNCNITAEDIATEGATINSASGTIISCQDLYANNTNITLYGNAIFSATDSKATASGTVTSGVTFNYGVVISGIVQNGEKPLLNVWKLNQKNGWQVLTLDGTMEYSLSTGNTPGANYYKAVSSGISFVESPTLSIASTSCNGGGINVNNNNITPQNPTFPIVVNEDNDYIFAMEDLWPYKGDYDMNDIVYKIHNITKTMNAENKVIAMPFYIKPLAAGSTKALAAAVQFDNISAGNITLNSTYNESYIEDGQTKANIILFPEVHKLFGKESNIVTNTYMNASKVEVTDYTFTITFASPVSAEDVIINNLNFYSIVGDISSSDRHEIHLGGRAASSKVTSATNSYKDENNMVWGIMIPVSSYKYPTEGTKIYDAYPQFNEWATSSGATSKDWYLHPSSTVGLTYTK